MNATPQPGMLQMPPPIGSTPRYVRAPHFTAAVIAVLGLALTGGGGVLLSLGGSAYYLIAGVGLIGSAALLWRGDARGAWLFGLLLLGTIAWSLAEVGLAIWALLPRLLMLLSIGGWLGTPFIRRGLRWQGPSHAPRFAWGVVGTLGAIGLGLALAPSPAARPAGVFPGMASSTPTSPALAATDWPAYGKDLSGNRFVPATQITPANVGDLQITWTFRTGEAPIGPTINESTPLKIGTRLILCTPRRQVIALEAETGRELWRFRPQVSNAVAQFPTVCRGVSFHERPGAIGPCAQRILTAGLDGDLRALDLSTGRACSGFGRSGMISLLDGFAPSATRDMINTSPGTVIGDNIVIGAFVVDGKSTHAPSGVVRAFNVYTGRLAWAWDMGRAAPMTSLKPGERYTESTPNAWAPFAADPALGLIYVPMGNPSPDFFGGGRRAFDEKYGSAIVALDARTGRPRWSFQLVHHDLWDLDLPAQPILVDLPTRSGMRHAVVQLSKTGDVFVLDRASGVPIVPVRELAVPQHGGVPDDRLSPTQPRSAISLRPDRVREADMWGISPVDQMVCRIRFRTARHEGPFTPPGTSDALGFPASNGVFSWGGATIDVRNGVMIVSANYMPMLDRLIRRPQAPPSLEGRTPGEYMLLEQQGTPYRYFTEPLLSPLALPCLRPPWGELVAIDLIHGTILWRNPLGTGRDNGPLNVPTLLPLPISTPNSGGNMMTASGLTFIGAATDRYLRAFDVRTGAELWRKSLPAGVNATPMSYMSEGSGRQFVLVTAAGNDAIHSRLGDYLFAFTLPSSK